jgi:hypothetical protein
MHALTARHSSLVNIHDGEITVSYDRFAIEPWATLNIYGGNILLNQAKVSFFGQPNVYGGQLLANECMIDLSGELTFFGGDIAFQDCDFHFDREALFSVYGYDCEYDPNSHLFTASLLYGGHITVNFQSSDEFLNVMVPPSSVIGVTQAISNKTNTLEFINDTLQVEYASYDALDELLRTGDYNDFTKSDIVEARQRIHSAIQHERQSERALQKSIDNLTDALNTLGWQAPPYIQPPPRPRSAPKRPLKILGKPAPAVVKKPPRK